MYLGSTAKLVFERSSSEHFMCALSLIQDFILFLSESAFLSGQHGLVWNRGPQLAIDGLKTPALLAIVKFGDPYSFLTLDLGRHFTHYLVNLVVVTLRVNCCQERFHDIQVTIGNVRPTDPLGK